MSDKTGTMCKKRWYQMHDERSITRVGSRWRTSTHVVGRAEMIDFARQWDPLPIHIDEQFAAGSRFGDVIASGLFTIAVYQRLVVDAVYAGLPIVAARSLRNVRFVRPLSAEEEVSAEVTVIKAGPGRPDTAEVTLEGVLASTTAGEVLRLEVDLVVASDM